MIHALAGPGAPAVAVETHTAALFLTGTTVFKVKKPVRFAFLDYTTREQRRDACQREVDLNRRLAPDVYLGVADITGPDGEPWDHAVVMRRLPATRSLGRLIADRAVTPDAIGSVARLLAHFHERARRGPEIDAAAGIDGVRRLWDDNLSELRSRRGSPLDPDLLERIGSFAYEYLRGREPLWEQRLREGAACDGHGDLQAADIFCLDDGPRILDCIEFDDRYRYADVIADVAFLVMDLEGLGAPDQAHALVEQYETTSGQAIPRSLLDHYVAYRALVRAKVAALRADQEADSESSAEDRRRAVDLLALCHDHLARARVRLVLVGGLPGTGKSTLATNLVDRMRADGADVVLLRSDIVRQEVVDLDPLDRDGTEGGLVDRGLYEPGRVAATYEVLVDRANERLRHGQTVVIDASWISADHRVDARRKATDASAEIVELCCTVDRAVGDRRLRARAAAGRDASDATPAVADALAERQDDWPEALHLDTAAPPNQVVDAALAHVGPVPDRLMRSPSTPAQGV